MVKMAAQKQRSFTLKGDDLDMVSHALECHAEICELMLNDQELTPEELGCAAFDLQHCRDLMDKLDN